MTEEKKKPAEETAEEKAASEKKAEEQKNALAKKSARIMPPMLIGDKGVEIKNIDDLWRFAKYVSASGFAPKGMERPEAIVVALQMGFELGVTPMSALQNICVVNGRPSVYGDLQLALVRKSGLLEDFDEVEFGEPLTDGWGYRCTSKRVGMKKEVVRTFTWLEAEQAGLTGKDNWRKYGKRMLMFRARSFNLRDNFGDVLKGFRQAEEAMDIPKDADIISVETAPPVQVQDFVKANAEKEPVDAEVLPPEKPANAGTTAPPPPKKGLAKKTAKKVPAKPADKTPPSDPSTGDQTVTDILNEVYEGYWKEAGGDIVSFEIYCTISCNKKIEAFEQCDAELILKRVKAQGDLPNLVLLYKEK